MGNVARKEHNEDAKNNGSGGNHNLNQARNNNNLFDLLPRDVLAIILEFALDFSTDSAPPPPLFEASSRLAQERKRAVDAVTAYQNLRLSCVAIRNASEKDLVLRAVLRKAGFFVPTVLWNGGTLTKAFFIQMKQLDDRIMHQKKQEKTLKKPAMMVACGMRAPPGQGMGPRPELGLELSFASFIGLNEKERARVIQRAVTLSDFLHSFAMFATSFDVGSSLQRYRMFLKLQKAHPRIMLIPSADILFVQLAHIMRTAAYWSDLEPLSLLASDPLQLGAAEERFYNEAVASTALLWKEAFGEDFPEPPKKHEFFTHQDVVGPFQSAKAEAQYVSPPSYVPAVFAQKLKSSARDLPIITLEEKDLRNDLNWTPQLAKDFREILGRAYSSMCNMWNPTPVTVCERLYESYSRFLYLCKSRPDLGHQLAPPVSVDLIWHAHQSTPLLYNAETKRILGFRLEHEPWPGVEELRKVDDGLACAWKTAFGTPLDEDHLFSPSNLE